MMLACISLEETRMMLVVMIYVAKSVPKVQC